MNGWYFYTTRGVPTPANMLWWTLRYTLAKLIVQPRRTAIGLTGLERFGADLYVREWREQVLPRHRSVVADCEERLAAASPAQLVGLIDELATASGDYYFYVIAVAGQAAKSEFPLAAFYRQHLEPAIKGSHQDLLLGLQDASP